MLNISTKIRVGTYVTFVHLCKNWFFILFYLAIVIGCFLWTICHDLHVIIIWTMKFFLPNTVIIFCHGRKGQLWFFRRGTSLVCSHFANQVILQQDQGLSIILLQNRDSLILEDFLFFSCLCWEDFSWRFSMKPTFPPKTEWT